MSKLIFIYKADSSIAAYIADGAKKVIGKGTCSLCNATWGMLTPKKKWREYLKTLQEKPTFYHRDDLPEEVQMFLESNKVDLPVVLMEDDKNMSVLVSSKELDMCDGDVDCLIKTLKKTLT